MYMSSLSVVLAIVTLVLSIITLIILGLFLKVMNNLARDQEDFEETTQNRFDTLDEVLEDLLDEKPVEEEFELAVDLLPFYLDRYNTVEEALEESRKAARVIIHQREIAQLEKAMGVEEADYDRQSA